VLTRLLGDSKHESITVRPCLYHQGSGKSGYPVCLLSVLDTQSRFLRRWCVWNT